MKSLIAFFLFIILTGCAVKPISTVQTRNSLVVQLSGSDSDQYRLVDAGGKTVAASTGETETLQFYIPADTNLNQCFYVVDNDGERLAEDRYSLAAVHEYRAVDQYRKKLENRLQRKIREHRRYEEDLQQTKAKLHVNRAFNDGGCILPDEFPWPKEPYTLCKSYDECLAEGGAICFSRFLGLEGCGYAMKELKVAGMLSSPGCAAMAARLAGEKYDMDDAIVDFLHGVADDVGSSLMKSDSTFDKFVGLLVLSASYGVKVKNAKQCTDHFVEKYYGDKIRWIKEVRRIRAEPGETRSRCIDLVTKNNQYVGNLNALNEEIDALNAKLGDVGVVHKALHTKKVRSPKCIASQKVSLPMITSVKRYVIGADIENFIPQNGTVSTGVKITHLSDRMPAEKSGLKMGDVIVKLDENQITDVSALQVYLQRAGEKSVNVSYVRSGQENTVAVLPTAKQISLQ